jgi:hypothetical protein
MAKISELPPITGGNTRSEDLFVIVNLVQGDDGTSNITRKELVEAIQYEIFSRIKITGGTISGVVMSDSRLNNVEIDNSEIEDTIFRRGSIDDTVITNSDANNIVMTYSTFNLGHLENNTANNITITYSDFSEGTGNNNTFDNTTLFTGTANNFSIFNSTVNNSIITNSEFNDGTGNNVTLTNSTIDDSTITDSTANNLTIGFSSFADGTLSNSTANNLVINASTFNDGDINNSDISGGTADAVDITNSTYTDGTVVNADISDSDFTTGTITDSTANNVVITSSEFNDGTGNNVTLTNSTIDRSLISGSEIVDSEFTGTMENVVSTNMTIRSSTADGLGANNSTFENGGIEQSTFTGGVIDRSRLADFDMDLTKEFEAPMDEESYFAIRNEKTGDTEQISYKQLFDEVSKSTAQALKVHADAASGDDSNLGTMLAPVKTLERAFELCLEKAGGELNRNAINNAVHISVGPGTYYTKGNLMLPDDCSCTSTAGQYATVIELLPGYENNNGILVGSGGYVQGFGYQNFKVDNFDFPEGGFAIAYRPGAKLLRSPYLRDSTQLSNFLRQDVEPPLNPYNSKGTLADLGQTFVLETNITGNSSTPADSLWKLDDEIQFSSGGVGYLSWDDSLDALQGTVPGDVANLRTIRVRNLKNGQGFAVGDTITSESGGTGKIQSIGIDDFPNRAVGRGGGCVLADRRVLDTDSLYTYVLCFGFTPRTQNGLGYVARDGAGVNGIGSLSIFVRCAFYALNGGQMTLNNSGTQFGDISMRAKGTTQFFAPKSTAVPIIGNTAFAESIDYSADLVIDDMVDYLTSNTANGGLGYQEYDSEKCLRDSGIVLDGTGYDIALDTNYWGRLGGITYRSPISYVVPGEQLEETKGALEYLRDQTKQVFITGNSEINQRIETSFSELLNVLEYGEENINPIIWRDTSTPRTASRRLLQDNKELITGELIDWIENNDEFYAYDSKACRRDVSDYILPAVKNDMLFDTNYNSVTAGRAYYMMAAKTVMENQNNETVAAYERLKDQTNKLIDGDSYVASDRLDDSYDNILQILENKGTKFNPTTATYDPATGLSVITLGGSKGLTVQTATYDPATGILEATVGLKHEVKTGDHIWMKPESIIFSCNMGSGVQNHASPAAHHPYYNKPCPVIGVSATTVRLNVGTGGTGQVPHTFVSATPNAFTKGHGLSEGSYVLLKTGGLVFSCTRDNHRTRTGYPRAGDPAAGVPVEVLGANASKITIDVGKSAIVDEHKFVSALPNAVSTLGDNITWSNNSSIPAAKRDARKQLQANRTFLQDMIEGYVEDTYYRYDSNKCRRDVTQYILPAVERDILTGSNYNAIQTGIAYRAGTTLADNVINNQLPQTLGSMDTLKSRLNNTTVGFTPSDASYNPASGIMVATIGAGHGLVTGDHIRFAFEGIVHSCDAGSGVANHPSPQAHHPYYNKPCPIIAHDDTTITMQVGKSTNYPHTFVSAVTNAIMPADAVGAQFTPTTASYDPTTGRFEATVGKHTLQPGDYVQFSDGGIVFSCDTGSGVQNDAVPAAGHPYFNHPCPVHSVTTNTIVCMVGTGGSNVHTFVSAADNSITEIIGLSDSASIHRSDEAIDKVKQILNSGNKIYTPSNATYNPVTGLTEITVGAHDLQIGDEVLLAPDSLTFTCATDGNATQHTYPTTTIASFTPTTASYVPSTGEFTANIGPHKLTIGDEIEFATRGITFTCELDGNLTTHSAPEPHHPFYKKPVKITSVDGDTIGCNVGAVANGGGVHTFVSAITNAIKGERQHPAYKKPVVVAQTSATSFTVNVGPSSDVSVHTFVSATANSVKTAKYISTHTPYNATYDASTGEFVAFIGKHAFEAGDMIMLKPNSVIMTCDLDGGVTEHAAPAAHHPAYRTPVELLSVTADSITMNIGTGTGGVHTFVRADVGAIDSDALVFTDPASYVKHYTPTTATYNAVSGASVITIPGHDLTTEDYVEFTPYSFTFTCAQDGNATEHSYPRKGDFNYRTPMQVIGVSGNDVTVQLIASSGGAHTFVSVAKECVSKVTYNSQGQYAREQLQQNKEYLAKDVSAYLDTQFFTFDGEKCTRDSGFILDAVRRDIATDGNWNSQFMGLGYVTGSAGANKVINDQLTETLASVAFLKAKVAADPNVTGTALTRANQSFDEITTIMGGGSASATRWGAVAALSDGHNNAGNQILLNKAFIQAEVAAYIAQEFPTLTYDNAACQRDTGYLVDSIIQDVKFGGNTCSVNFARLYFENAVSVLPADQVEPTYKTWEHIAEVVWQIIRDITVTVTTGNAVSQDESGSDYGFEIANLGRDRVNIITKVISENTLDFLPKYIEPNYELDMVDAAQAIDGQSENLSLAVIDMLRDDHNGLPFKSAVCERDIGIMVDALSRDIEYGGNENLLEVFDYYFRKFDSQSADYEQQRSTNVLPIEVKGQFRTLSNYEDTANVSGLREAINVLPYEQRLPTQLAFRRLAGQVGPIVAGVQQAQTNPKFTATDASYDPATGIFVATIPAGHLLDTGSVVYLKPNGFTFSCDMGQGGGVTNHAAPQPHHPFYNKGVKVISSTATTITLNVGDGGSGQQPHTFVSALADSISTGPYHLTDGTAASLAKSGEAAQLIYAIADLIDNTNIEAAEMPTLVKASFDPNRTLARKQLQRNRDFIIDELQGYLHDRYYVFDGDKCKRDVNMLIDAVKTDILTGSNHNAVLNGTAYRINTVGTNKVINEQLTETVKGIEFARDKAIEAVTDGSMKIKTAEAFNEIIDIMVNGRAAADAIVYGTAGPGPSRLNGRSQLLNNRTFLIAEMTAWLAANRPSLSYDVAKCERDTGYALDAIAHDIQFGGNFATLNFTKLYFENGVNVGLPLDQVEPSAAAFAHLGDCAKLIVQDTDIGGLKSAGNTETQNVLGANAGVLVGGIAESLFDITSTAVSSGTMLMAPSQVFPDPASFGTVNQTAYAEIEAIKDSVGTGLLAYLSEFFQVLPYSETKCRRDTGYIIDAISHDIQYGGNAATVQTAGMYFENAVNTGLQIEQRMGTRDAFLHLAKIVEHVVGGKSITTTMFPRTGKYYTGDIVTKYEYWNGIPSYSNTAQDMATVGANPDTCIAARKLTEIIANAVDDNIETRNTIPERIDVLQTWMADSFVTSKEAVERRSDIFAEAVITYLSKEWNALSFPDAKCRRDIGYIIDAISHDIQHDTNFATLQSAGIYFENGVSVLPVDTQNQYADILQLLGDAVEQVVQEIPVTNASNYTLTPQNTLGTAATATEGTQVHALVGIIEQSIRDNDTDAIPRPTSTAGWVDAELTAAASKIVDNTEELAADVTEFINSNFKVLDYSKAKCRRDTGYLLDAFSFDLNFGGNSASRWNADFYFWNQVYRLPEDQRTPTAKSYRQLGKICKDIVIGEYPGQSILGELGTEVESKKVEGLANIFYETQLYNDTKYLPVLLEADYTYSNSIFTDAQSIIGQRRKQLQKDTVRHVNSAYNFIDINLARRDARNLLTAVVNDFAYDKFNPDVPQPTYSDNGSQNAVRTYTASFFNYDGTHVFPVFNPSDSTLGLKYKGSVSSFADLSTITGMKPKWSYIVATDYTTNFYAGDIYYWNGSAWTAAGQNNTDLLDAFAGAWTRMKTYINTNLAPDAEHQNMITGLFDDCLTDNILRPETLIFGSLVESIAHQFNGASAGVNRNALPLNFRNLGAAISAIASVLNENGGRIRWSGADELNNQYFARGLRINGRTGRIEGRPFTSSVRKLARRASNSRAVV